MGYDIKYEDISTTKLVKVFGFIPSLRKSRRYRITKTICAAMMDKDGEIEQAVIVPAGFETDGKSTPRIFWWLFPVDGAGFRAAVVHDFLYRTQELDKDLADRFFLFLLKDSGTPLWQAYLQYYGVKFFGGKAWQENKRLKDG